MKLHEREALTEQALRLWRSLDHKLVWGRFNAFHQQNPSWDLPVVWEEVGKQIPDFALLVKVFDQLSSDIPTEPWSSDEIDKILDVIEVKAICFRSGYYKEHLCKRLKQYQLNANQKSRLRKIYADYLQHFPYRRELADLARLMIKHADQTTIALLESLEEKHRQGLNRRYRIFREMILNQRRDLR